MKNQDNNDDNDDGSKKMEKTTHTVTPKKKNKKDTPPTIIGKNGSLLQTNGTGLILPKITPAKNQEKE